MKLDFIDFAKPLKVGFIGFGKMAEAVSIAMIESKKFKPEQLMAFDLSNERLAKAKGLKIQIALNNIDLVKKCDVIVLATKPQTMDTVLNEIFENVSEKKIVISIAAGISLKFLEERLPKAKIVRVMPNINCLVGEMAAGFSLGTKSNGNDKKIVQKIFGNSGKIIELEEEKLDAVTAVSGSSPAFFASFAQAIISAGVKNGLSEKESIELSLQSMKGTAKLMEEKKLTGQELIDLVASPGGTTIAGLNVLEANNVFQKISEAIDAAAKRSKELKR